MPALVSIIISVFNSERFLPEAISSAVTQSFSDWELIIVDDGSTDASIRIAQDWCTKDKRLSLLTHPLGENRGISASRNLGIAASRGELIAFLDADDVWLPGKLAAQVAVLNAHPEAAMAFAAAERWYSWDASIVEAADFVVPSVISGYGTDRIIPPPELLNAFLKDESLTPCTCTVLVRRSAVLRVGAFEASFRGLYDDQVFYAKLALAEPVYVSSDCIARYRQHDTSCCATARRLGIGEQARKTFLQWLEEYQLACVRSL